jgi:hypothetical protein
MITESGLPTVIPGERRVGIEPKIKEPGRSLFQSPDFDDERGFANLKALVATPLTATTQVTESKWAFCGSWTRQRRGKLVGPARAKTFLLAAL